MLRFLIFTLVASISFYPSSGQAVDLLSGPVISGFVEQFITIATTLSQKIATSLGGEALTILNYAFLAWVLLQVAKMMLGMENGGQAFWNIIRRGSLYVLIAAILGASSSGGYWTWTLQEPLSMVTNGGMRILQMSGSSVSCSGGGSPGSSAGCLAKGAESVLQGQMGVGWKIMETTTLDMRSNDLMMTAIQFIFAGLLMLISFLGLIYFGFFILDVFLRLLILAMFSAPFIAFYLMKPTRPWAQRALNTLLGSLGSLIGACAVLGIISQVATSSVLGGSGGSWTQAAASIGNATSPLSATFGPTSPKFWLMLFLSITMIGASKAISKLMDSVFSAGGGVSAGTPSAHKMSGVVGGAAKGAIGVAGISTLAVGGLAAGVGMSAVKGAAAPVTSNIRKGATFTWAKAASAFSGNMPLPGSGSPSPGGPGGGGNNPFGGSPGGAGPFGTGSGSSGQGPSAGGFGGGTTGPTASKGGFATQASAPSGQTAGPPGSDTSWVGSGPNHTIAGPPAPTTPPPNTSNASVVDFPKSTPPATAPSRPSLFSKKTTTRADTKNRYKTGIVAGASQAAQKMVDETARGDGE